MKHERYTLVPRRVEARTAERREALLHVMRGDAYCARTAFGWAALAGRGRLTNHERCEKDLKALQAAGLVMTLGKLRGARLWAAQ